jgi:hypothetical protein
MGKKGKASDVGATTTPTKVATSTSSASATVKRGRWTKSTFKEKDLQRLREMGLVSSSDEDVKAPRGEVIPHATTIWIVVFVAYFYRCLSLHVHEFLRGLLYIYGLQLYFIMLSKFYLGIQPHWGLWKYLHLVKRHGDREGTHEVRGYTMQMIQFCLWNTTLKNQLI